MLLLAVGGRAAGAPAPPSGPRDALGASLRTTVRLSAEVGPTRLPVERLVAVPPDR
ncbi:MAG: hypothetical protein M3P50_11930 [Actinomycetota bacterium]|nr:hypothetical protein [Actinomycetota bacterium]